MATDAQSDRNRTFLARYGATILRGGIAAIPHALFTYQAELGLAPQQTWFICAILAHKWDADMPSPSLSKMAEETGISRMQLHRYQKELIEKGLLAVINRRTEEGGKDTNLFDFSPLFGKLEELLVRDRGGDVTSKRGGYVTPPLHGDVTPRSAASFREEESNQIEERRDSNLPSLDSDSTSQVEFWVKHIGGKMHDESPKSSVTRARRLWEETELTMDEFLAKLQEASERTLRYSASIRKTSSKGGVLPTKNRMPYFFATLEELLGLKES